MAHVIDAIIRLRDDFSATLENVNKNTSKFAKQQIAVSSQIAKTSRSLGRTGKTLTKDVTVPIIAAGTALYKIGESFEAAENTIRSTTGKTGKDLDSLNKSFKSVYGNVPSNMADASSAIANLNQKLNLAGKPLENLATQELNLSRITKTDLGTNITASAQAFKAMNLNSSQYSNALDQVFKVSQNTGVGLSEMLESIKKFSPTLKTAGMDFSSSISLIGGLTKSGVNVQQVMAGLTRGISTMAKSGVKDANKALQILFDQIKKAPNSMKATSEAVKIFGTRAGPALATAIKEGKLNYSDFMKTISGSKDTINKTAKDTMTFTQKLQVMKNKLAIKLEPIGNKLLDSLDKMLPAIQKTVDWIGNLADKFSKLSPKQQEMIFKFALIAASAGPVLIGLSKVTGAISGFHKGIGGAIKDIQKAGGVLKWLIQPGNKVVLIIIAITIVLAVLIKYWPQINSFIQKHKTLITALIVVIGSLAAGLTIARIAQTVFNATMALCPLTLIVVGIMLVIAAIVLLIKHWKQVSTVCGNVFKEIMSGFAGFVNYIISGINSLISTALAPLNALIKGIDKIPGVKIPQISIAIPKIPKFALGTSYFSGGTALVGEHGPELVRMPRGSQVISNSDTKKRLNTGKAPISLTFNNYAPVRSDKDIEKIANKVAKIIVDAEPNVAPELV